MDVTSYLGLEWQAMGRGPRFDCWGLVRLVLAEQFGLEVPSFRYGDDYTEAVAAGIELFEEVEQPAPGDVVLFARPLHIGLVIAPGKMLHITHQRTSCVERIDAIRTRRTTGFYRLRGAGEASPV